MQLLCKTIFSKRSFFGKKQGRTKNEKKKFKKKSQIRKKNRVATTNMLKTPKKHLFLALSGDFEKKMFATFSSLFRLLTWTRVVSICCVCVSCLLLFLLFFLLLLCACLLLLGCQALFPLLRSAPRPFFQIRPVHRFLIHGVVGGYLVSLMVHLG